MRQLKNFKAAVDADRYDGMTEGELVAELLKNVGAAKENGTFSAEQVDEFVSFVSPDLDQASRMRLMELAQMIKGV